MKIEYPTLDEPAPAEYVLDVLRNMRRIHWQLEFGEPGPELTFETTIDEWWAVDEFPSWRASAAAQNEYWQIDVSMSEWKAVLKPARTKRLGDVCRLIADHAKRPQIRPAQLLGQTCRSAGAFLTLRAILHEAGAPAGAIAPSTPLEPFLKTFFQQLVWETLKLEPGAIRDIRIHRRARKIFAAVHWTGLTLALAAALVNLPLGLFDEIVLFLGSWLLVWIVYLFLPGQYRIELGGLCTFRDLAEAIAAGADRAPQGATP